MKYVRLSVSVLFTVVLLYVFNRSLPIGNTSIPPLGKFLDPFHGFWKNSYENNQGKELSMEGLTDKVTVFIDSLGIPHIFAQNENDLYLAQGYVTACDRLWQMEFQTHAGAGRISEILGEGPNRAVLDFDRSQRRLGMVTAAKTFLKALEADATMFALINSYTKGVNEYIHSLSYEDLPLEYKLLDYAPEEWTNLKSAIVAKNMAKTLNIGDKDVEMTNALKLLGKDMLEVIFPDMDTMSDPVVDKTGKWNFTPVKLDSVPLAVPDEYINILQTVEKPVENIGSNNWAVGGSKTATGSPILSNDMHLTLGLPSIWYAIHLNCPGNNVMGSSLPGIPMVITGCNDSIAWGITNAQRDAVDWYKIQFKDAARNEYLSDGKWVKATKVIEQFKVKGSRDYFDTVVYTHHGPITYDQNYNGDSGWSQLAFRWTSHDESNETRTFYSLNRAKNHADYMSALNYMTVPGQNFVFASVSGDIAMRVQGKFPVRRKNEGRFVLDGTKTSTEWKAFIPNDQNVQDKNPARGFVSSANQYPADVTYPYYITAASYESYRNRRINQRLTEMTNIAPQDMMSLQQDNFSIKAFELLPTLLLLADSGQYNSNETAVLDILRKWNYNNDATAEAPVYFEAWWRALYPIIWDEFENSKIELPSPTSYNTIRLIKESKTDFPYFDKADTPEKEMLYQVVIESFKKSVEEVNQWKAKGQPLDWAHYKDTYVEHLIRLAPFSVHALNGGNRESVNATTRRHGPSWRMIVSLEKSGVKAWGVYPGGQSGNPGSRFYTNFIDEWESGKYLAFQFSSKPESYTKATTLTLNPNP
jgi:penicillin G amidase